VLQEEDEKMGISSDDADRRRRWNGKNLIDIPLPPICTLLATEILHPFLWFQMFSIIVWCMENYYAYAMVIVLFFIN